MKTVIIITGPNYNEMTIANKLNNSVKYVTIKLYMQNKIIL